MATVKELSDFLAQVERRAFKQTAYAVRDDHAALDIVQDAMMKLVQKYGSHPADQWKPLFYSILQTRILDWHRRQSVHNRFRSWFHWDGEDDETENFLEQQPATAANAPDVKLQELQFGEDLNKALSNLPLRQQQVFLLRVWEGMDIAETAKIMQCSESSVKTHYTRALEKLRGQLGAHQS